MARDAWLDQPLWQPYTLTPAKRHGRRAKRGTPKGSDTVNAPEQRAWHQKCQMSQMTVWHRMDAQGVFVCVCEHSRQPCFYGSSVRDCLSREFFRDDAVAGYGAVQHLPVQRSERGANQEGASCTCKLVTLLIITVHGCRNLTALQRCCLGIIGGGSAENSRFGRSGCIHRKAASQFVAAA